MNRRIVGVFVALLTLCLFGVLLYCNGLSRNFDNFYVSDEEWSKILSEHSENRELDLSSLKFNGYNLNIAEDKAYYSIVDNGWHDYNPAISLHNNLKFAAHGEKISPSSIENNTTVEIVIYNDSEYRKLDLVSTTLPILNIDFDTTNGDAPQTREDEFFRMSLFDNRKKTVNRVIKSDGQAHRRGNVSFGVDKPNLSLKLTQESVGENTRNNPLPLLGMNESDNWILSGMYYDYEKVRDAFAAKLWKDINKNSFNVENAFEFRYVEVIINGNYSGLYLLGAKPSPDSIASEIVDEDHPDIMFKIEDNDDIDKFVTDQTNTLRNYKQETEVSESLAYGVLKEYFKSVFGSDNIAIENATDMTNAVDFHLFANVSQNADIPRGLPGYKNAYISFKWDGERYRAIFTPWDFDIALGSSTLFQGYYNLTPETNVVLDIDSVAALRRNGSDTADKMIQKRYFELRQGALSDTKIDETIDSLQVDIFNSGAFRRNQERWESSQHSDANIKLNDFRTHIHQRLSYLDGYYAWGDSECLHEAYAEIPNYITEYLKSGILLAPDDPNYYTKQTEVFVNEEYTEEPAFW